MTVVAQGTGTATFLGVDGGQTAAVSVASQARVRYNTLLQQLELSQNTGPYQPISVGGAEITVANIAALTAWPDLPLTDGSIAAMHSLMAIWQLRKTAVDAPDGITIIPTNSGTGRWFRMRQQNKFWHAQTAWHVNEGTGNDENQGNTALAPLATFEEIVRRWGAGRLTTGSTVTITLGSDLTGINNIDLVDIETVLGTDIVILGSRTVVYSGSVTAKADWQATPVPTRGTITDAAIPVSWTASGLIARMLVMTSGAANGYTGWVQKDMGAKTAQYSPLYSVSGGVFGNPAVADTFNVVTLTQTVAINISGMVQVTLKDLLVGGSILIQNGATVRCENCSLGGRTERADWQTICCLLSSVSAFSGSIIRCSACSIVGQTVTSEGALFHVVANSVSTNQVAAPIQAIGQFKIETGQWWGVFDAPAGQNAGIRFTEDQRARLHGLFWGLNNNTNYGIVVDSGRQVQYVTPPTFGPNVINDVLAGNVAAAYTALPVADVNLLAALVPYT